MNDFCFFSLPHLYCLIFLEVTNLTFVISNLQRDTIKNTAKSKRLKQNKTNQATVFSIA